MDNSLVPRYHELISKNGYDVLILVVMDNSLVLERKTLISIMRKCLNPCCNGQ